MARRSTNEWQEVAETEVADAPMYARGLRKPQDIMNSEEALEMMRTYAISGASLSTIEAAMGLRDGVLKQWLDKAKQMQSGVFVDFARILKSYIAEGRLIAEAALREKNPEKWLEKNSSAQQIEQVDLGEGEKGKGRLALGSEVLDGLKVLLEQGYDLNDVIGKGMVTINKPLKIAAPDQ